MRCSPRAIDTALQLHWCPMRQNFFEVIGMADVERVHSQMLAWVFDAHVLTSAQKSEVLAELTGRPIKCDEYRVSTEHDHIDVLIETESAIIAIENKIKITEHDQQLTRYQRSLEHHALPQHFVYLSLLPESVTNSMWIPKTYAELHSELSRHAFTSPSNFDEHIFNEYVQAVGHLAAVVKAFDQDHTQFLNVFTDGRLTKRDKRVRVSAYTNLQNYVRANQLETTLQRHFIARIRDRVVPASVTSRIEETHGAAFLHIVIASRSIGGLIFDWAVQFQERTVKLNCSAHDYARSTCNQLPREVMADFQILADKHHSLSLNRPRTKAYVSLSKKLNFDWSDTLEEIMKAHAAAYAELSALGEPMAMNHGIKAL